MWQYRGSQHAVTVREPDDPHDEKRCYIRTACGLGGYAFDLHVLAGRDEDVDCADCHGALGLEERAGNLTEAGWAAVSPVSR